MESAAVKQRGCLTGTQSWLGWQGGEPAKAGGREAREAPK